MNPVRDLILFENKFLESFTKTPWYLIVIVWLPLIVYYLSLSSLSLQFTLLCFCSGIFIWTFLEYILHRLAFHGENLWVPDNRLGIFIHFLLHGIHHAFPQDSLRLLFPPALAMFLVRLIFIPFFSQIIPTTLFYPMLSGGMCGFLMYDLMHYYLHHFEIKN